MNFLKGYILSLLLIASVFTGLVQGAVYVENKPQNFSQSTVQLGKFCSGTVINDPTGKGRKTILTAKHCVDGDEKVLITIPTQNDKGQTLSEDSISFDVVRVSDKSDLALLQSDSALFNIPALSIYNGTLSTGDNVFAVGYPGGSVLTITEGYIGPIEKVPAFGIVSNSEEFRRSTTMIAPGSSGGSLVLRTWDGPKLVGVATGINTRFPIMTYWSPIDEIHKFLEEVKKPTFEEVYNEDV